MSSEHSPLASDIKATLEKKGLLECYQKLPPSHQREYLFWINSAKKSETRQRRIAGMVDKLKLAKLTEAD
jgi:uncharacterized protein YdeI (YjbR/CyaY-like superfamily)